MKYPSMQDYIKFAVFGMVLAILSACSGGGASDDPSVSATGNSARAPVAHLRTGGLRALPVDFAARKAVAYSGYRTLSQSAAPSKAQILEDLNLLSQSNFRLIRLFGSSDDFSKVVLQVIREQGFDIKVQLGVWISGSWETQDVANQAEIQRGIVLANTYSDIVVAVSVGNETMVNWSTLQVPPSEMAGYIAEVRNAIAQPVTSDDNWAFWADWGGQYDTAAVTAAVDYVSIHVYPLLDSIYDTSFNWQRTDVGVAQRPVAMMDSMLQKAQTQYYAVRGYLDSQGLNLPIIIGETGWKAVATDGETFRAHPVNQKLYYDRLSAWTGGPLNTFYFEAFDEPWKQGDDGWGLFDVNRRPRYVVQHYFPNIKPSPYSDADAICYVDPNANPAIIAPNYVLFSDYVPQGAAVPSGPIAPATHWYAWNGNTETSTLVTNLHASGFNTAVQTQPTPVSWGWGVELNLSTTDDLSFFNVPSGRLNFSIKTTYPGKLEVGFFTGLASAGTGVDDYLAISPGQFGYMNDGNWHNVSIPISLILPNAAPAFGQPASASLNLGQVSNAFVIADRYAVTQNAPGATDSLLLDWVYWSK